MTTNDDQPSMFWTRGSSQGSAPTGSVLFTGKHVGEDSNRSRTDETIGYIVVESGSGVVNGVGFTAAVGAATIRSVDNGSNSYNFSSINDPVSAVLTQSGMVGGNGSWAILRGAAAVDGNTLNLSTDEDQLADSERSHTSEKVAYWIFESFAASAADQHMAFDSRLFDSDSDDNCQWRRQLGDGTEPVEDRAGRWSNHRSGTRVDFQVRARGTGHRAGGLSFGDRDAATADSIFSGDWDWRF
jgi:hypothetical protein